MRAVLGGICLLLAVAIPAAAGTDPDRPAAGAGDPATVAAAPPAPVAAADAVLARLGEPLRGLVAEVLERNPDVARARAEAAAAEARAPQVRALPDPMAALTLFIAEPETRVGPQRLAATFSQRLPWFGKLALREREALLRAAAARAEVEAKRLALVTETRRLFYELAFLAAQEREVGNDRATLDHYEELARARYASGMGLEQAVVKIQAEITRDDNRLLEIAQRRAVLVASLNALRDRPPATPPPLSPDEPAPLPPADEPALRFESLSATAQDARPEVARSRALIAAATTGSELAAKEYRPDVTLGLGYTVVDRRSDPAGRAMPPQGNGDDIVGLTVGVNLPVWRQQLAAGVEEAARRQSAAEETLRAVVTGIDQTVGELVERIPLTRRQLSLFDDLLRLQAQESLRSAEAAYAAGSLGALDLLDAERVLLDVEIATARTRADYQILWSRLEGAVGAPLAAATRGGAQ